MVPENFPDWKDCITRRCGLHLSSTFIAERIRSLSDDTNRHTIEFVKCYGEQYRQQVIGWFTCALQEKHAVNNSNYDE
ncbi:MAG: hypothetical protein KF746_06880 [Chitinophagaceae bacterium]|nr:hypothetical protein [Chitinophagaceae bacterium]